MSVDSSVVEYLPSKQVARVRFPVDAFFPLNLKDSSSSSSEYADLLYSNQLTEIITVPAAFSLVHASSICTFTNKNVRKNITKPIA